MTASYPTTFDLGSIFSKALDTLKNNAGAFIGGVLVAWLVIVISVGIAQYIHPWLASIVNVLLVGPFYVGIAKMSLTGARGGKVEFNDVFWGFSHYAQAVLAALVLSILLSIGFALCVIPGILLAVLYMATYFYLADQKRDFWTAMESSRKLTSANYVQWLLLGLVVIVINFVGLLLCLVGLIVTAPLTAIMVAIAYDQQQGAPILASEDPLV